MRKVFPWLLLFYSIISFSLPCYGSGWAVLVGIDRYQSKQISPLEGASNDARALAETLSEVFEVPEKQLFLLTSGSSGSRLPTTGNIVKALKYVSGRAKPEDLFVLAFSGHGVSSGAENYLLTYYSEIAALTDTALGLDRVKELIEAINTSKKLLIIDACRNDPEKGKGHNPNMLSEDFARGISITTKAQIFDETAATLFSCSLGQRSYEWPDKRRGFFSWYLEQGLKGAAIDESGSITLASLVTYLQKEVPDSVQRTLGLNKRQKPYVIMEGGDPGKWVLRDLKGPDWARDFSQKQKELEILAEEARRREAEEGSYKKRMDDLDAKIEAMKERLGAGTTQSGDTLDALVAMVRQKEEEQKRLDALRERRVKEEKKRQEEIQRLEIERAKKRRHEFEQDIGKYEEIAESPFGKEVKDVAWKHLTSKYPESSKGVASGDIQRLRDNNARLVGEWKDPVTGMEFVWVPGGCYEMGCGSWTSDCYKDEKPVDEVCVDGFWIGKYEVTQGQWKKIMGNNPSNFKKGDDYSVEQVSWNDAKEFIKELNARSSGGQYRLPTEAEWEYACRSGGKGERYSGGSDVDRVAWYDSNSGNSTHAVGTKASNGLNIYDMSGNVWEWCEDVYDERAYSKHNRNNPVVTSGGSVRVDRGGGWYFNPGGVRCANRGGYAPGDRFKFLGFRLLRER